MEKITALVVDDESHIRTYLNGILKKEGIVEVFSCEDGENAINLYRQHKPNMVFLDIHLPNKNGLVLLEEIIKINPEAFVVMVSGNARMDYIRKALDNGAATYMVKPIKIQKIVEIVNLYREYSE